MSLCLQPCIDQWISDWRGLILCRARVSKSTLWSICLRVGLYINIVKTFFFNKNIRKMHIKSIRKPKRSKKLLYIHTSCIRMCVYVCTCTYTKKNIVRVYLLFLSIYLEATIQALVLLTDKRKKSNHLSKKKKKNKMTPTL